VLILNKDELNVIIEQLNSNINLDIDSTVVLLQGDLASGKTTFVKAYVKYLGLADKVTSPTFSLQTIYGDNIFHYDIYNKTLDEFIALGLLEEFEKKGIHFIEWGDDKLKSILVDYGFDVVTLQIKKKENKREYKISV